jgi:DUF1009 family protein
VIASEDRNGTADLIRRAGELKKTANSFLLKACKPQQDMRVDLPTIGVNTIEQCKAAGLAGITLEAGKTLVLNRAEVIRQADQANIFVVGI